MLKVRIYYHDTDCGGVVYYANYLKYLEEARTEFFSEKGLSIKKLAESGILFVVSRQEIDYKMPASYGEVLQVDTRVSGITAVKIDFQHEIKNQDNRIVCNARTVMVCVDKDLKPKAIPEDVKNKIA